MREHVGRAPGIVLIALVVVLRAGPAAWAQPDIDRVLKGALDAWKEGSPAARARAIETLASLGDDAAPAVPILISVLRDPSPLLRCRAAAMLGQMGSVAKDALPALTAMLEAPEASVQEAAARALGHQGSRAKDSIKALVASLHRDPDRRCLTAAFALASIGEPALPAVIDLLNSGDPAHRRAAIEGVKESIEVGLWRQGSPAGRALSPLYLSAARDADQAVRIALARMLVISRSEIPPVRSALDILLRDPDAEVRLVVAEAVDEYSQLPAGLRDAVLELLKDADSRVRVVAARAIPGDGLGAMVIIERLLAALKDPEPDVRAAAAQKLAGARWTNDGTDGKNRAVRIVWTSKALARHPAAGRTLRSALDDSHAHVRAAAAHLLPAFPAEAAAAIPRLMETLRDPAPAVRAAAAGALAELGPRARAAVRALLGIVANMDDGGQEGRAASFAAARALAAIGGDARAKMLRLLTGQLNSLDDGVRQRAEQIVVQLGPPVVNDLFRILSDPKSPRRIKAEVQGLLFTLLMQGSLAHVLTASPPSPVLRAAIPVMRALARDADPEVQIAAHALLSAIDPGIPEAAELYRDHIRLGKDPDLRDQWLTWVIKPAMIPALIKGLEDRDIPVRLATVNALSNLAERLSREEKAEAGDGEPDAAKAQAREDRRRLEGQAARALLASLEDPDGRIRWIAAQTLGVLHVEAKAVVPALTRMVNVEAGRVPPGEIAIRSFQEQGQGYALGENKKGGDLLRIAAIQGLGGFGREAAGAVPELVRALRDRDLRVRWFAAEALGLIGPDAKAAVPALVQALQSRDAAAGADDGAGAIADAPIRLIAAFALGRIGPNARAAIPDLIAALSGPDSRVRAEAARALGLMGPEARPAVPELIRLARRGSVNQVAEYAWEALAQLGPVAVPALIEMLHDDDPAARIRTLRTLGQMSAKTAVPVLEIVRCLRDRDADVRVAAAAALPPVGDRPEVLIAVPRLVAMLRDQGDGVADAARNALTVIGRPALPAVVEVLGFVAAGVIEYGGPFETDVIPLDVPAS